MNELPKDLELALKPSQCANSDHPDIIELADRIVGSEGNPNKKAVKLFEHVRDSLAYNPYTPFFLPEHYLATTTIERGKGFCVQKSVVLVALLRAVKIPARLVFADMVNHRAQPHIVEMLGINLFTYHCYVEMWLDDKWLQVTPSFDKETNDKHDFPLVVFDGHNSSTLPAVDHKGRKFVEYTKHFGSFIDVPMEPMLESWYQVYGDERVDRWKKVFSGEAVGSASSSR